MTTCRRRGVTTMTAPRRALSRTLTPRASGWLAVGYGMPLEDVLGYVLESSQLRGRVFCVSTGRAPWGLRFAARSEAVFHLVTEGSAVLLAGGSRKPLGPRDL